MRGFFAPAARCVVGFSTAFCTAVTPFLKHAAHAHGNEGDEASDAASVLPTHGDALWKHAVQEKHSADSQRRSLSAP